MHLDDLLCRHTNSFLGCIPPLIDVMLDSRFSLRIRLLLTAKDPMPRMTLRHLSFACAAFVTVSLTSLPSHAQSADIEAAQTFLHDAGYSSDAADGFMGPRTRSAFRAFQTDQGLESTGEIDPATLEAIKDFQQPPRPIEPDASMTPSASESDSGLIWGALILAVVFLLLTIGIMRRTKPERPSSPSTKSEFPKVNCPGNPGGNLVGVMQR